jgi:two-component system, LytTR family, sensor histidine kinase AlgZ
MCRTSTFCNRRALLALPVFGTLMLAALLYSTAWILVGRSWAASLEIFPSFSGLADRFMGQVAVLFLFGVLLFLLASALHYLLLILEESRAAEKQALELRVLAREAELRALRAQIDPHFLFNCLNSISALTIPDPKAARRMALLLADFMRTSLAFGNRDRVTFSEELKLVEGFLDIEKVRFGPRIRVDYNIQTECGDCLLPPLLLQPLVENAVTHGIAPLVEGGTISLQASERSGILEILIDNPHDSDIQSGHGTGLGIRNVRERLANIFAGKARLDIVEDDRLFRVSLRMPCVRNGVHR